VSEDIAFKVSHGNIPGYTEKIPQKRKYPSMPINVGVNHIAARPEVIL
jgi:hypothetical protein